MCAWASYTTLHDLYKDFWLLTLSFGNNIYKGPDYGPYTERLLTIFLSSLGWI